MGSVSIVRASAGSGKTYRLAYEYIAHVIANPWLYRNILAVTFTNKATEEMKQRIMGDHGHLSNEAGAALACTAVRAGARTVILAHLSAENNTPARARNAVALALSAMGADPDRDLRLSVAPRAEPGLCCTA